MDDYLAVWAESYAFGADAGQGLKREVDDAAFTGVHGIEFEGLAGGLDSLGGSAGHHFQFFDAKGAIAGAVQEDLVLEGRLETKDAVGEMLDGLEEFGAAFEEEGVVAAGEFGEDFCAAVVGCGVGGERSNRSLEIELGGADGGVEEFLQRVCGRRAVELAVFDQV